MTAGGGGVNTNDAEVQERGVKLHTPHRSVLLYRKIQPNHQQNDDNLDPLTAKFIRQHIISRRSFSGNVYKSFGVKDWHHFHKEFFNIIKYLK